MDDKQIFLEPLLEKAEKYCKTSYELIRLNTIAKTAQVVSLVISRAVAILLLAMFLLITTIGVSLWLGDLMGKNYYGFFCVALLYGIIGGIIFFILHKRIKNQLCNSIIAQLLEK